VVISVIVPAYNVEKYIDRCINSILSQDYRNFEVIIIDDCSTDNTLNIIKKNYFNDTRVRVIQHEENLGLGPARNTGLKNVQGQYVFFVDSDDWIEPGTFSKLIKIAQDHDTDITACGVQRVYEDGTKDTFHSNNIKTVGGSAALELLSQYTIPDVAWNKLYKRSLIDKYRLQFPAIFHEDVNFAIQALYYCNSYIAIPDQLYNYYQSSQSITRRKISEKHIYSYIQLFKLLNQFLQKVNQDKENIDSTVQQKLNSSIIRNVKYRLLTFYAQTEANERNSILRELYTKEFGDAFYYVQGLIDSLIEDRKPSDAVLALTTLKQFKGKKVVFFGTGSASMSIYNAFPLQIAYFIDNDPDKWHSEFLGLPIYDPKRVLEEDKDKLAIIIASQYYDEISMQLTKMNFEVEKHYWDGYKIFRNIKLGS
jgi:glycosyltransferase involved in cell wall biosynthesis